MASLMYYIVAAFAEIAGCFTFWMYFRQGRSLPWLIPGVLCLTLFAFLLTRVESDYAGRTYAAYGGIYIFTSLLWLWLVEKRQPDVGDWIGALMCVTGAMLMLWFPRRNVP